MTEASASAVLGEPDPVPAPDGGPSLEERIMDSALECGSRWGVAKTSLDDVARQAGCSRATIYRLFPGGKASLVQA
ncbi:MAG: TetR/AcrR family transcriptional regulator, partial [Acidimicrobiales bacterium]